MHIAAIVPLVGAASLANAAVLKRAPSYPATCDNAQTLFSSSGQLSLVNSFCTAYLGIRAKTITVTSTLTVGTVTTTGTTYSTTTSVVVPPLSIISDKTTSTGTVTSTPNAVTSTATVTSTAYLDNDGNTITVMRRDLPTPVVKRGAATPAILSGWARPSVSSACQCLNIQPSTITRTSQTLATATASAVLSRVIHTTTTANVPLTTTTSVKVNTATLVAPAPIQTTSALDMEDVDGCPPNSLSTFLCPEGTGDDDGTQAANSQINCSVDANDGYSGACDYWNDDGSPAGSTLTMDDPDHPGDPAYQWSRAATYGDSPDDDCPTWADWTCAFSGSSRRRAINLVERAGYSSKSSSKPPQGKPTSVKANHTSVKAKPTSVKAIPTSIKAKPTSVKANPTSVKAASTTVQAQPTTPAGNGLHTYTSLFDLAHKPLRGGNYVDWSVAQGKVY